MLRKVLLIAVAAALCAGCATTAKKKAEAPFVFAKNGAAQCRIIVSASAPPSTQYAVQELQTYLKKITGAEIPVADDSGPLLPGEIIVGSNKHFGLATKSVDCLCHFGKEEYLIRNNGKQLILGGGEPRGTLYAVYGLLEDHLGCRWFTTEVERIPEDANLSLAPLNEQKAPVLEYREPFVLDAFDGDWAARNRCNGNSQRLEEKHGGKVVYCGFVHTFNELLPPAKNFDPHPEYFSLVKGKRLKENTQLCCTNEDVIRLVTEEVRKRMRENPQATVFSVSQNDWHNYCECDKCTALADKEGSQMGPMLFLVNRVAKAVAKEFPDKAIDTLAYQYTRKPPKSMRPEPNVIIRLCSIECCFSHPFETCDGRDNKTFVEDVQGWSRICNRLWVWNYNTSFSHYFTPFPNLRVRKPNIQFLANHSVTGIFEQDTYTTLHGEFNELSGYLGAKLLWNPEYDTDTAINEFLEAVYGAASTPLRQYLDLIHDKVQNENLHMDIWIGADHPLLGGGVLEKAVQLWDQAEAAVANDPETAKRVRIARLSIDFAVLERMRQDGAQLYTLDHASRSLKVRPEFAAAAKRFLETAASSGVTNLSEANGALDLYRKELEAYHDITAAPPKTPVTVKGALQPGLRQRVYEGDFKTLPDFATLKPAETIVVPQVALGKEGSRQTFAFAFDGYFNAPADGIYVFHLRSNDGSKLLLNGDTVIDHDGQHKMDQKTGIVALKKGYYPIRVEYFQAGGGKGLELSCVGPGFEGPVTEKLLSHTE